MPAGAAQHAGPAASHPPNLGLHLLSLETSPVPAVHHTRLDSIKSQVNNLPGGKHSMQLRVIGAVRYGSGQNRLEAVKQCTASVCTRQAFAASQASLQMMMMMMMMAKDTLTSTMGRGTELLEGSAGA